MEPPVFYWAWRFNYCCIYNSPETHKHSWQLSATFVRVRVLQRIDEDNLLLNVINFWFNKLINHLVCNSLVALNWVSNANEFLLFLTFIIVLIVVLYGVVCAKCLLSAQNFCQKSDCEPQEFIRGGSVNKFPKNVFQ